MTQICVGSLKLTPELNTCETPLQNHDKGLRTELHHGPLPWGGTCGGMVNITEKPGETESDIETTAHSRWVWTCVWNLTGLIAYNNNKNSNKNNNNNSIFQRTKSL